MSQGSTTVALAEAALERREIESAWTLFQRAELEGADPDRCAAGRWMAAMLSGDLKAAWRESDAIRLRARPDPHRFWNGETLAGKHVIVRCLHGFGDAIQFLRYAPNIRAIASRLVVECAPGAVELIHCLPGIDEVISWGANAPKRPPRWDVQVEVMEIPYLLRSKPTDLPVAANYLRIPAYALLRAATAIGFRSQRLRVGVVWSSGEWNLARSLPLPALLPILNCSGVEFWNLQGGAVRNDWRQLLPAKHLRDAPLLADSGLVPLAAVVAHLDLVISVDTLAAHLAGALGIPCFLMLQFAADWRWMTEREDSPWYPSLRIFRQPVPGDWNTVISDVKNALVALLANTRLSGCAA